ncbi:inositol monophosphatase family protein [Leisingera methylohalidivorans]|uniref:Histidinol-phosphate phosphatase n=1 Tax=Leisingera methylohalidivorans DSM 14336 TaxID=999552 RepID=V9VW53_9RHOB|nr:inositol monophosphatase family protein [Leisingera methylohalidivorans]AHD02188.1 histidinol-phosphate phosphatase [Leisingera methylohalidivorans DSM 14336]
MTRAFAIEDHHIAFALALADTARDVLSRHATDAPGVSVKPDRSLVTQMDLMIEARLRAMIADRFPSHGIIGEEEGVIAEDAEAVWILDPIDGTAPFIMGLPVFGTLIALAIDGVPLLGVIDIPGVNARWLGAPGRQTTCNGRPVSVRSCAGLSQALMTNSNQDYIPAADRAAFEALRAATATRVYGGAALNYGRLAEGRTDLAVDAGQKVFDYAPFRPVIEGAGGIITDWRGDPLTIHSDGRILAAGDSAVHRQAVDLIAGTEACGQ